MSPQRDSNPRARARARGAYTFDTCVHLVFRLLLIMYTILEYYSVTRFCAYFIVWIYIYFPMRCSDNTQNEMNVTKLLKEFFFKVCSFRLDSVMYKYCNSYL